MTMPNQPAASDVPPQAPAGLPAPRPRRWRSLLLALLIFVSGAIVGGGLTLIRARHGMWWAIQHPEEAPTRIAARLRWKLGLSDDQTEQVEAIVRKRQQDLQAIRREVHPRVIGELDRVEAEIDYVLNDSQRAQWHVLFARLRERWIPPLPPEPKEHPKPR
jgi:hypothetical protein